MAQNLAPTTEEALRTVRQAAKVYAEVGSTGDRAEILGAIFRVVDAVLRLESDDGDVQRSGAALADTVVRFGARDYGEQ